MDPIVITRPSAEQISLVAARLQLRLDDDGDSPASHPLDPLIAEKIAAARRYCEEWSGRSLASQTLELALDAFPTAEIELRRPPVISITSVIYVDADGNDQTLAADQYALDNHQERESGWLLPAIGTTWPATQSVINAVKVRYVAGYSLPGDTSKPLPDEYMSAMMLVMTWLVRNAGGEGKTAFDDVREAATSLMRGNMVRMGMA